MSLSVALLLLTRAEAYVFDEARNKVAEISAPVMEFLSAPLAVMREWVGDLRDYFGVYEENRRLKAENERLMAWKTAAENLEQRLARYEALLDVQLEPGIGYITARVIGDSGGPFVRTYIVNAGRDDGVDVGQAVVDAEGLVGRVVGSGATSARVLLISDLNSRIPVLVEPSHYRAIMRGANDTQPELLELPEAFEISPGDRVVTSGHGGMLPPGLPVGEVILDSSGKYRVEPFAREPRIDYVRILKYEFPNDVDEARPVGEDTGREKSVSQAEEAPAAVATPN
jgi:rod shape-determining protein MreC